MVVSLLWLARFAFTRENNKRERATKDDADDYKHTNTSEQLEVVVAFTVFVQYHYIDEGE